MSLHTLYIQAAETAGGVSTGGQIIIAMLSVLGAVIIELLRRERRDGKLGRKDQKRVALDAAVAAREAARAVDAAEKAASHTLPVSNGFAKHVTDSLNELLEGVGYLRGTVDQIDKRVSKLEGEQI